MSDKAKEVVNAIKKYNYDTAVIVLMNPSDLTEMSKSDFPDYKFAHAHFVAERAIGRGNIIMLREDSSLKRTMYEIIKEHPEKEFSWKENKNVIPQNRNNIQKSDRWNKEAH